MTFKDLLEKGEGTIYLVNIKNPYKVEVYDALIMTMGEYYNRYEKYLNDHYWGRFRKPPQNPEYIVIKRKSHDKRNNMVNGYPRTVDFNGICSRVVLTPHDLSKASISYIKTIAFVNKEEACDYVIEKIKRQKLELNAMLLNANKLKFSIE